VDPNSSEAWHNLAIVLNDLGDHDRTIRALSFAIEANPKHAVSWLDLGNAHLSRKRYQDAATAFRHSTELQPNCTEAWSGLGMALAGYMQVAQANEAFRRVVALTPDDVRSWKELTAGLALEGQYHAALEAAEAALRIAPNDAELQQFHTRLLNPSSRKQFFDGFRFHTWKEYLDQAHGIKIDP